MYQTIILFSSRYLDDEDHVSNNNSDTEYLHDGIHVYYRDSLMFLLIMFIIFVTNNKNKMDTTMKKILLLVAMALPLVFISCSDDKDEPVSPDNHEWVDLGLPSGTLWATCNVGAHSPEEYGDYFAWGETAPKEVYTWETYKWCNGSYNSLTKYCTISSVGSGGFVDNKTELDSEDDAAWVNWGASWRMPSLEQLQELLNNCTWTWTTLNGVNGILVSGPNGASLFLPAAGGRWGSSLNGIGSWGGYWSRTLRSNNPDEAYGLEFGSSGGRRKTNSLRPLEFPVRAVRVPLN